VNTFVSFPVPDFGDEDGFTLSKVPRPYKEFLMSKGAMDPAVTQRDEFLEAVSVEAGAKMCVAPRSLPAGLDVRIAGFPPNLAIEWGYNLYLLDALPEDSDTHKSAKLAIAELEGFVETFPVGSRERLYLTACRLAATGFARGIDRRKKAHLEGLRTAKERKDVKIQGYAKGLFSGAFLSSGFRMLLIGGLSYAIARAIFELPMMGNQVHTLNEQYASLASALGITLISSYINSWWTGRSLLKIVDHYDKERTSVDVTYSDQVVLEYRLAAETADNAWFQLTGQRAAVTKAFETLLVGIMKGARSGENG
jgi:hypothetical protein